MDSYSVRDAFRSHEEITSSHRQLGICEQEHAFAVEHVVHLVHASVRRSQGVRLAGFEPVQPHEQARDS